MMKRIQERLSGLQKADFLTRSSFGISAAACAIMLVFGINNLLQDRFYGAVTALLVAGLFIVNTVVSARGDYLLHLNLFGIVPALALASVTALVSLEVVGSYWPYLCVFGIYFILPFRYANYANLTYVVLVLGVASLALDRTIAIRFCTVLVGISVFIFIFSREIDKSQTSLRALATTDSLTGVLNRTLLADTLRLAIDRFRNRRTAATVCLIDIDNFKTINDSFGHDAGDKVLVALASEITRLLTVNDTLFRIGGEEFLVLMNDTTLAGGRQRADAILVAVQDLSLLDDHQVTVSIGVSEVEESYDWKAWMKVSDEKLYLAKDQGRNRVVA